MGHCFPSNNGRGVPFNAHQFFSMSLALSRDRAPWTYPYYNKRSSSSRNTPIPSLDFQDIQAHFSSGLIAHRVQNSSRVSDRESVELHRFFGVIHADRKSTTMVSFHFQNIVRFREKKKEKLVGHRFSFSLSLSRFAVVVDATKEFHGLMTIEINELYLIAQPAQIFNRSIDTYRLVYNNTWWIVEKNIYINAAWTYWPSMV